MLVRKEIILVKKNNNTFTNIIKFIKKFESILLLKKIIWCIFLGKENINLIFLTNFKSIYLQTKYKISYLNLIQYCNYNNIYKLNYRILNVYPLFLLKKKLNKIYFYKVNLIFLKNIKRIKNKQKYRN